MHYLNPGQTPSSDLYTGGKGPEVNTVPSQCLDLGALQHVLRLLCYEDPSRPAYPVLPCLTLSYPVRGPELRVLVSCVYCGGVALPLMSGLN